MTSQLPLYLLLCFTTIVTPGAGVLYTVTGSLKYGVRYAWPCVAGNAVGVLIVSFLTAGGLGAVLAASPVLFTTLQAFGGLYLIYLGIQELRAKPYDLMRLASASDQASESQWTLFRNAVLLQGTNPMLFLFLFALFPQFVMKESPFWPQATILIALFSLLLILIHSAYAVIATAARGALHGTRASLIINRISGILFIALGLMVFAKILSGFF